MEQQTNSRPYVTLNNGVKMPQIGFGTVTMGMKPEDFHELLVSAIMDHGYRAIDTAKLYQNEEAIGKVLQECFQKGIKREELFITTKLWHDQKGDVEGALRLALSKLQLDYIDLFLVHWALPNMDWSNVEDPVAQTPLHKVWAEMERLCEAGLTKSIGVSNYTLPVLIDMLAYAKIKPVVNQIEIHPYLTQNEFVSFHSKLNIMVESYAPLGSASFPMKKEEVKKLNVLEEPIIVSLAEKHSKTPAQIVLNWHLSRGLIIIPKTTKISRLSENINCYDFKLSEKEYSQISSLNCNARSFDPLAWSAFNYNNMPYF